MYLKLFTVMSAAGFNDLLCLISFTLHAVVLLPNQYSQTSWGGNMNKKCRLEYVTPLGTIFKNAV